MFKGWSIILYGTSTPAQTGDPLAVSRIPSPPLPTSFNNVITNNNSYNYGTIYTKPPSNVNSNNKNNKKQQFGYTPAYPSGGRGGGGKGNKNKNGGKNKNKQVTTVRPNITSLSNNKNRISTTTTTKPKTTISWNSLGNSWGKQQSLSVIPQKTAIKAPKQVKNDSPPAVSPTVISRKNLNLFEHYDKIQQIFPELQPYQDTTNSMISPYNSNTNNNNKNFDMTTTATTASYSSIVVVNNKPSRANSKMVSYPPSSSSSSSNSNNFDPDLEFIDVADYPSMNNNNKKNKGSASSWSSNNSNNNMKTQNSRISSSQRNGNGISCFFSHCCFNSFMCGF